MPLPFDRGLFEIDYFETFEFQTKFILAGEIKFCPILTVISCKMTSSLTQLYPY